MNYWLYSYYTTDISKVAYLSIIYSTVFIDIFLVECTFLIFVFHFYYSCLYIILIFMHMFQDF